MKLLSALSISCLGIIVYSNTFHSSFHFDDTIFIIDNHSLRSISDLQAIWNFMPCRFLTFLSLALNYHFHGLNVFGYHIVNLVIHLVSAILVWWLTLLTLSTPAMKNDKITLHTNVISLLAGLIFVSHPLQTEAVTYIWQRTASLATLFYLASLCFYVKSRVKRPQSVIARSRRQRGNLFRRLQATASVRHEDLRFARNDTFYAPNDTVYCIISLLAAIAAMFTKETAITLPLIVLFYEYSFLKTTKNLNWKHIAPFLLTIFIIPLTILFTKTGNFQQDNIAAISPIHYLLTQLRVIVTYIRLVFLPFNQNVDYDYHIFKSFLEWPVLFSFLFLTTILYCCQRLFTRYRLVSFSCFWFFLTLLPESSVFSLKDVIFEHRLYLPLAGYSMFLVSGMYYLLGENKIKTMIKVLTVVILVNAVLAYQRNAVWRDEITLLTDVVKKSPHKERPRNNLGLAYSSQGNLAQAVVEFTKSIEINPQYTNAYINRGFIYNKEGNYIGAIADYTRAIEIKPDLAEAYINRGNVYSAQGDFPLALADYNKSTRLKSNYPDVYFNIGFIYQKQGQWAQAISNYDKVLAINPKDSDAYNNRAICVYRHAERSEASPSMPSC